MIFAIVIFITSWISFFIGFSLKDKELSTDLSTFPQRIKKEIKKKFVKPGAIRRPTEEELYRRDHPEVVEYEESFEKAIKQNEN